MINFGEVIASTLKGFTDSISNQIGVTSDVDKLNKKFASLDARMTRLEKSHKRLLWHGHKSKW